MTPNQGTGALVITCGGQTWSIPPGQRAVIGRSKSCDITIDNPHVSRQHIEVSHDGLQWGVRDLGSANGTFVEGEASTAFAVTSLTVVVLGGTKGEILTLDAAGAPPVAHEPSPIPPIAPPERAAPSGPPVALAPPSQLAPLPPVPGTDPTPSPTPTPLQPQAAPIDPQPIAVQPQPAPAPAPTPVDPQPMAAVPAADPPPRAADRVASIPPPVQQQPPAVPADWYPDPHQPGRLRYWDGTSWTDHYHPAG